MDRPDIKLIKERYQICVSEEPYIGKDGSRHYTGRTMKEYLFGQFIVKHMPDLIKYIEYLEAERGKG